PRKVVYSEGSMIRPLDARDYPALIALLEAADADPSLRTFAPDSRTVDELALELGDDSPEHESLAFVLEQDGHLIAFVNLMSEDGEHVIEGPVMTQDAPADAVADLVKRVLKFAPQRHYEFIDAFIDEENKRAQAVLRQAKMQAFRTTYLYELERNGQAVDRKRLTHHPEVKLRLIRSLSTDPNDSHPSRLDVACYRDLYRDTTEDWHDRLTWSDDELIAHFANNSVQLLVAEQHTKLLGHLELEMISLAPETEPHEAEIAYFGILPEARGHSIGKRLVQAGIDLAFERDSVHMLVARAHDDERAACKVLESLGFHLRQSVLGFTWELRS
ncbi:MAG: GNAT family N-acetyltransferase, partial [Deinococcota bacterium]